MLLAVLILVSVNLLYTLILVGTLNNLMRRGK
jgi:hypothetical protein